MGVVSSSDRGVVTAMFAVIAVFLFLIISVLAEGGRKLSNLSQAEDLASEAARAAAATLDLDAVSSGRLLIDGGDAGRARAQAQAVVDSVSNADIVGFSVEADNSVVVSVRVRATSFIPGFDIDGRGSHRADAFNPFGDP